ncbi:hypothetical protein EWS90_28310 [Pseudomonas aeruginosa]|uniref:GIY-YIG nuclease family protein n=1 Tax=Pseudomonas aeruginosa TaxID=287 RepID=UPI00101B00CF|nr:GIY-YIG nuclease family protein [Pseudomonas aeruginosa]QBC10359.1 hypothetical protein EWS90_28310 [Pseudomonas aeruginosa]
MQAAIDTDLNSKPSAGYLYYARLNTEVGKLYKLGFTTLGSVQERLGYQGGFHDDHVEAVLLFKLFPNAYEIEQKLHGYFRHKRAFPAQSPRLPFYGNGQSEFYMEDVLGLDMFTDRKSSQGNPKHIQYRINMMLITPPEDLKLLGPLNLLTPDTKASKDTEELEAAISGFLDSIKRRIAWASKFLSPMTKKISKALISQSEKAEEDSKQNLLEMLRRQSIPQIFEIERKLHAFVDPIAALEEDTRSALAAFLKKDLQTFEGIVDVPMVVEGIFASLNKYNMFYSDYLTAPNNCGMGNLMEAMDKSDAPIELLKAPLQLTYRPLIRYFIRTHKILREDMAFPEGPLYEGDMEREANGSYTHRYSYYYGPKSILDEIGRDWSLESPFTTIPKKDLLHFCINVSNPDTGFSGKLLVRVARNKKNNKIFASFPNLMSLIWDSRARRYPDIYRGDKVSRSAAATTGVVVSEEDEDWNIPISSSLRRCAT